MASSAWTIVSILIYPEHSSSHDVTHPRSGEGI
uniref:Uncharacterized protein n=1 Tax=Anguilla anguilla TaxID=7936 RepID=A0A0E9Y0T4_ANGAN